MNALRAVETIPVVPQAEQVQPIVLQQQRTPARATQTVAISPTGQNVRLEPAAEKKPDPAAAKPKEPLAEFIDIEIAARKARSLQDLRFVMVNSTRKILKFDTALVMEVSIDGKWKVTAASGTQSVDRNAPLPAEVSAWVNNRGVAKALSDHEPRIIDFKSELESRIPLTVHTMPYGLLVPVKSSYSKLSCYLLMLKEEPWIPQAFALMLPLAEAVGHSWASLEAKPKKMPSLRNLKGLNRVLAGVGVLALGAMFIPVPLSVISTTQLVPIDAEIVAAPIDGVIDNILVEPGATVVPGQKLVQFSDERLRSDVDIASSRMAVAEADYIKYLQSATSSIQDSDNLAKAKASAEVAKAELDYANKLLEMSLITANTAGVAVYADRQEFVGKPLSTGQKILEIADPSKVQVQLEVDVKDTVSLKVGSPVTIYWDSAPGQSVTGEISRVSYRPSPNATGQLVLRAWAHLDNKEAAMLGSRGVGRIAGDKVQMWYYLFRRPLTSLRQWLAI